MFAMPAFIALLILGAAVPVLAQQGGEEGDNYSTTFNTEHCTWVAIGQNAFFSLAPGTQHVLEGEEDGDTIRTVATVLHQTRIVDGAATRVIEERHYTNGIIDEVSRNFYSMCLQNNSVFYFGEEVDFYEDGAIVGHEGAWLSGTDGARYGLYMPSLPILGARYYQEIAPGSALDRAEITAENQNIEAPAGSWEGCLETLETTPLDPDSVDIKIYCPGVGIVVDGPAVLLDYRTGNLGLWPGYWD